MSIDNKRFGQLFVLCFACVLVFLPLFAGHIAFVIMLACVNILLAASMRISYTVGLWNFGVVGFMAIGAYTSGLVTTMLKAPFLVGLVCGGVAAALVSLVIGLPALRLKGVYFLLLTLGFTEVVRSAAIKWLPSRIYLPGMSIGGMSLSQVSQYYFAVTMTVIVLVLLYLTDRSRPGLTWKSISQAEALAQAVGVNTYWFKVVNFALACFVAGLAGSLYGHMIGLVTPWGFSFRLMMFIAIWNFTGGIDKFSGPIVGAFVLSVLTEPLSALAYYESFAYAGIIICIVFLLPGGLVTISEVIRPKSRRSWAEGKR